MIFEVIVFCLDSRYAMRSRDCVYIGEKRDVWNVNIGIHAEVVPKLESAGAKYIYSGFKFVTTPVQAFILIGWGSYDETRQ